jgi:molybdenum cofactor cytidylyltransferase
MVALEVIILAAGRSTRLGQPKALVDAGGVRLIARIVSRIQQVKNTFITAVTNDDLLADVILACPSIQVVLNPDPEQGRTASIQRGLASILERNGRLPERLLIVPVDRPGWSIEVLNTLLKSDVSSYPVWNNQGGHPLLLVGDDIKTVYLSEGDVPLSSLVSRTQIPVEFPFLHLNIDTVDDLEQLNLAAKEEWF